ncbi:MAG: membrane-bound lytic murein transglycosylase MltF [Gammaproteobacteria bacterium]|nr:membrane-bound lytic murein transglycosylase MltF [Gammaproteobacteria bacterium]
MRVLTIIILALLLGTCQPPPSLLEQVKARGELRVVSRNSPTTFYLGAEGPAGLEYDLASQFATHLGVNLNMYAPENFSEVLPAVRRGEAHIAAAGLSITRTRKADFWFGPPYLEITPQIVYRYGEGRPRSLEEIEGSSLGVISGSSHEESLARVYDDTSWVQRFDVGAEELLAKVASKELEYAVADSVEIALGQRYYPELRAALDLAEPEPLAWAFQRGPDDSLYREAVIFLETLQGSGQLAQVIDRHYGNTDRFDYVGTRIFMRHIDSRLPAYRETFEEAALLAGVDWRLLAAIGYQESHWDPDAVSPTGVRGIMMLTRNTARHVGIDNRRDAEESILGGARYFDRVKDKIPDRIEEPDRTWLALAAYNVGFGHLEDARILTEAAGDDPDKWIDVREYLPLLSQKKWYSRTKHGYARGREPVLYVENIRSYYDILVWITNQEDQVTSATESL